ncbi:hypothetical protein CSAL01_08306 [Colletotrichum salicis]|uniref:Uncharacterized protein n=1 Tax=Colletotrichum salicis TaxID=1209931 RepID=A0A135TQV4_9PEZI|nr:hypothetical protein CSAL01_08306 [Colletotrichum salicis]
MASFVARRAFSTSIRRFADEQAKQTLTQESKRNPETLVRDIPPSSRDALRSTRPSSTARRIPSSRSRASEAIQNILGGVMVAALGGAGLYFGRSPTSSTSESPVLKAGMPWETDSEGKYKYHPGGNPANEPKDAPSAVNTVIIPDVTLPKELHEKYNKWGKDGYP